MDRQVSAVWAFDEGRFGLKVWFRRRWCPRGVRPPWVVEDRYEWLWVYVAVEPQTGECCCLLLPRVNHECLQHFLDAFGQQVAGQRVGLVLDGAGSHRSADVHWPEHVVPLPLPPYSPELNPAEAVFRQRRARLANRLFADVADLEAAITAVLAEYWAEPHLLRSLTGYPWWLEGVKAITKSAA